MAIVQISRIQHRRGLSENLPQLASAELGWVIDQRRVFIGNGSIAEGAPEVGNTEILTQYSDILGLISTYTYKGEHAGYVVQNAVARSLQSKIDEQVSVLDFGATGDGVTDDTDAIQNAIYQLFIRNTNEETRRTLYFPAGVYKVTDVITLPPFAHFIGDGADSTFIINYNSSTDCVVRTADSLNQIYPSIGSNSAEAPNHMRIIGMNFENTVDGNVCIIDNAYDVRFENCKFSGPFADSPLTTVGNSTFCVKMTSTPANDTHTIVFEQCEFEGTTFGVVIDDDAEHVVFDKCTFDSLYKGVKLGEGTTGAGNSVVGPQGVRVTNSYFDNIYAQGYHSYAVTKNVSAFNSYRDVGNGYAGISNPITPVVEFGDNDNYSIGDNFDRTDVDDMVYARVEFNGFLSYSVESDNWIKHGRLKSLPGNRVTLQDNTSSPTATGIQLETIEGASATIEYTLTRGSTVRRGTILIALDGSNIDVSDDFVENNGAVGVTFSADISSGYGRLLYTTTNTGNDAALKYNIRLLAD